MDTVILGERKVQTAKLSLGLARWRMVCVWGRGGAEMRGFPVCQEAQMGGLFKETSLGSSKTLLLKQP